MCVCVRERGIHVERERTGGGRDGGRRRREKEREEERGRVYILIPTSYRSMMMNHQVMNPPPSMALKHLLTPQHYQLQTSHH